jgi:hypothetical protein
MSLFATNAIVFFLLASGPALAQAGKPSASGTLQTRTSQDSQTIKITRSGEPISTKAPAEHFTGSASIDRFLNENPASHTSNAIVAFVPVLVQCGTAIH